MSSTSTEPPPKPDLGIYFVQGPFRVSLPLKTLERHTQVFCGCGGLVAWVCLEISNRPASHGDTLVALSLRFSKPDLLTTSTTPGVC